jgi:hypothetical protein
MNIIAHLHSARQKERRANLEKVYRKGFQVSFHIMSCWGIGVANPDHPLSEKAKEKTTSLLGSFLFCLLERVGGRIGNTPRYHNGSLYETRNASRCFSWLLLTEEGINSPERFLKPALASDVLSKSPFASSYRLAGWWRGL